MNPTDEQKQWFWEQCGFFRRIAYIEGEGNNIYWHCPNGDRYAGYLPPIDLNNLFKYAVPILLKKIGRYELLVLVNNAVCDAVDANLYGQEGIPDHLFWAVYKALGGKE